MKHRIEKSIQFPIGIIFHGNKIWLSELLTYILMFIFLTILLTLGIYILKNEFLQSKQSEQIKVLKTELIHFESELSALHEKRQIYELLLVFAYNKVSLKTISTLTNVLHENSSQFGYDPLLLLAVIHVESYYNPKALGRYRSGALSGAFGLMQLKVATAQEVADKLGLDMGTLTQEDLLKPDINLVLGAAYIAQLISYFKSFKLGIIAYNIGPGTLRKTMRKNEELPMDYYRKVLKAYFMLKQIAAMLISVN